MSGQRGTGRRGRAVMPWAFVVTLVLVSLNLRAPFVAVAPISGELRRDLGVGGAAVGTLTSLPVLCFGLFAPVALLVVRRTGAERAVVACLLAVIGGSLLRSAGSFGLAVAGTVVIGLGITVGNIVVPVLIRRETPPARVGVVTGVYVSAMNAGSMLVSLVTAPVAGVTGWRVALGARSVMAAAGLVAWTVFLRHHRRTSTGRADQHRRSRSTASRETISPRRKPIAWLLGLAFAGQATSYYALTAWLPTLLADEIGLGSGAAGAASSVFQICAIIGALGVPLVAARTSGWLAIGLVGLCWMAFPVQLLLATHAYLLGSVLGGIAQGGGFAALFTVVVQVSHSDRESAQLSAFVQGVGYVFAAVGPTVLGATHDATGAWTVPVLIVLGTTAAFSVLGVSAALTQARHHPPV
ncbi:MAG TPA: MFS transporter [Nocardioidaceae bacterium]|nr:MFS transporter [Nocardioidaceae bacterium]